MPRGDGGEFGEADYRWTDVVEAEQIGQTLQGEVTIPMRMVFSGSAPRIEILQTVPGTVWVPADSGVHHLGYWSDDLEADLATLEANGLACEVKSYNPDGSGKLLWAYTKGPTGLRIELVKPGHGTVHRILVVDRAGTLTDQRVGSFRMCWAMMLRWISEVPPAMVPAKLPI
jgi:Glyoxalase/Bleomycin resistance protein/Dioxygenase superfamily